MTSILTLHRKLTLRYLALGCGAVLASLLRLQGQTFDEKVVAAVLLGEAEDQGRAGQLAVAEVIANRARIKRVSPLKVVTSRSGKVHAFSCLNGKTVDEIVNKYRKHRGYAYALHVATLVCRNPERLPQRTRGATHFTRKEETPDWAFGFTPVAVLQDHAFYRVSF